MCDLGVETAYRRELAVIDFKCTKTLPSEPWPEQKMQLAAYAKACDATRAFNIYISTSDPGKIVTHEIDDLDGAFKAFQSLLEVWQWLNNYRAKQ
jgi:hypothetical protein